MFVARRFKAVSWPAHSIEKHAGIVDTMSNGSTEQKPASGSVLGGQLLGAGVGKDDLGFL
jgi:hypothetical protein